jgi:hypothetical protein
VYSFFKASRDIFVLVCVSLDLFWYCVVMMCGLLCYIAPETCRANDERNKEYSVHLVGP